MKRNKVTLFATLATIGILMFTGCSAGSNNAASTDTETATQTESNDQAATEENEASDEVAEVSLENPIKVDKEAKTITVLAQVNGKYFTESTRHCSVFKDGTNGAKSVFTAHATPEQFHDALMEVGGQPSNNMNLDNATTTHVEGTPISLTVTWNGADKQYDVNEVVKDSNDKKIEFRFGGNLDMAKGKNTGCLSCLDSCPVGIISNTTYTYGAVEKRKEVSFTANKEVLPEDGTYVATIYTVGE